MTTERVVQWFLMEWDRSGDGCPDIPDDIQRVIAASDIDNVEPIASESAKPSTKATEKPLKDVNKRWRVIQVYYDRSRRNECVSVRAVAEQAGCSEGYASKVIKRLRPDRADAAPRGHKDSDGEVEAYG